MTKHTYFQLHSANIKAIVASTAGKVSDYVYSWVIHAEIQMNAAVKQNHFCVRFTVNDGTRTRNHRHHRNSNEQEHISVINDAYRTFSLRNETYWKCKCGLVPFPMLPEPEAEPTPCWHEGYFLVQTYRCHRYNGLYSHAAHATCKSSLEFHRFIGFVVSSTSPVLKQFLNVCAYTRLHLFVLESTPRFNYKSWETTSQRSGAEWKWRWPSWAPRP